MIERDWIGPIPEISSTAELAPEPPEQELQIFTQECRQRVPAAFPGDPSR